ncbi:hypothetical protein DSM106972_012660 [Dulcicalothrix desertica PCC 7102]|uniref:Uncharacterized protein n=1 Tax=Dulcicalothrix desertica PCC 7102 TaxID=232991 RepID=A0A3S1BCP5_9CYAN|nr:hypothetical protein [Dulcicalothrix desertica]RUT09213.1 hypothetical protein DSM106972_012660 [Dulcicalothrix desertica PCC 7102]TWH55034.1 hypothetical protein CAL7102_03136 [Dulcicalothrix desertica PCC 7102]
MNIALPRLLKSTYRREPVVSGLITVGVVDAVIGGFGDSWSLFAFGLGTAGLTLAFRWWRLSGQSRPSPQEEKPVKQLYLPERSSSTSLPMLSVTKKKPPY